MSQFNRARLVLTNPSTPTDMAARMREMQEQTNRLVAEHMDSLQEAMAACVRISDEIAKGGDLYHAGIRSEAKRVSDDVLTRLQTIQAIRARNL